MFEYEWQKFDVFVLHSFFWNSDVPKSLAVKNGLWQQCLVASSCGKSKEEKNKALKAVALLEPK